MYDIIGDVHGHADELIELLESMGYELRDGAYRHESRTAVFVGDFIDRGSQIAEVLAVVRAMHSENAAVAVMGNHEFNALAFHTEHTSGHFLREHSDKNVHQHAETLRQLPRDELQDHLEWFRTLPMWLELDGIRVVHACWDPEQIRMIATGLSRHGGVTTNFLVEATDHGTALYHAVDDVLKGKEMDLPEGVSYSDKDGHERRAMRIKWFRAPDNDTIASYALTAEAGLPEIALSENSGSFAVPYPADAAPLFFGHYWLRAERPEVLASNVACVDYSVAKGGSLCAYRWGGEQELTSDRFCSVAARE